MCLNPLALFSALPQIPIFRRPSSLLFRYSCKVFLFRYDDEPAPSRALVLLPLYVNTSYILRSTAVYLLIPCFASSQNQQDKSKSKGGGGDHPVFTTGITVCGRRPQAVRVVRMLVGVRAISYTRAPAVRRDEGMRFVSCTCIPSSTGARYENPCSLRVELGPVIRKSKLIPQLPRAGLDISVLFRRGSTTPDSVERARSS